jgi:hypothetical protein
MKKILILTASVIAVTACTPTIKVEAPDKPIEINMNVKIQQEVRVRVDRDLDRSIASNPELFGVPSKSTKSKK